MRKKKNIDVYVTRDSCLETVWLFPHAVGIRKFHGCVAWGAAWQEERDTTHLSSTGRAKAERLTKGECKDRFGFYPHKGTAWLVEYNAKGKMKKSQVDIDFSD